MDGSNKFNCPVCNERMSKNKIEWSTELTKEGCYSDFLKGRGINSIGYYRCIKCQCLIAQPMLKKGALSQIYEKIIPTHPHGQRNHEAIKSNQTNRTMKRNQIIYELIVAKKKSLLTYAEIGCPYQGFITSLTNKQAMKTEWNEVAYLIHREKEFWGKNCMLDSKSCRSTLPEYINKIELKELKKTKNVYDLIGIFNYIDHVEDPLNLIKILKQISKNILLVTHEPRKSGPQHRFVLDESSLMSIFEDYGDVEILNIGGEFSNYIAALVEQKH